MRRSDPLEQYLRRPSRHRLSKAVRAYYEFVWKTAYRVTGNEEDARDVCQDVFLKLLLEPPPAERVSSMRGFLACRVLSRVEHLRRSSERRRHREKEHAQRFAEPGIHPDELDASDLDALNAAVRRLPEELRLVVEFRYLGGLSGQEIASTLDISERTVQRRLDEAKDRLKQRLEPLFGGALIAGYQGPGPMVPTPPADLLPGLLKTCQMGAAIAAPTAASSSGTALASLVTSGKTAALAGVISLFSILGGWLFIASLSRDAGDAGPPPDKASAGRDGEGPAFGAAGHVSGDVGAVVSPARGEKAVGENARGGTLRGRITGGPGVGVGQARVLALPLETWRVIGRDREWEREFFAFRDCAEEFQALREAYLACAEKVPETTTSDDGAYAFRNLPEGTFQVLVAHPDYLPGVESRAAVRARRVTRCDVELAPGERIAGRVVDEDGQPVPGAEIEREAPERHTQRGLERIRRLSSDWDHGRILVDPRKAASASDGSFRLVSLEPGYHVLTARKAGYIDGRAYQIPGGAREVILTLKPGSSLRGRLLDPTGRPLAGAQVRLVPERTGEVHRHVSRESVSDPFEEERGASALSLAGGRFELRGIDTGRFELRVSAEGFPPLRREVVVDGKLLDVGDLALEAPRSIAGIVRGSDGKPFAGARVWAEEPPREVRFGDWSWGVSADLPRIADTRSGVDGRFVLGGLPEGSFLVKASAGDTVRGEPVLVAAGAAQVEVLLRPGITVQGRVEDDETSKPIAGVVVETVVGDEHRMRTDERGLFEIRGVCQPARGGAWTWLRAHHPDYRVKTLSFARHGWGAESPLTIRLSHRDVITGRVTDTESRPVGDARIWLEATGIGGRDGAVRETAVQASSADDGWFSLEVPAFLSTDSYAVSGDPVIFVVASSPLSGTGRTAAIRLPDTGEKWPDDGHIVLRGDSTVEGRVTDAQGKPVGGARIALRRLLEADGPDARPSGTVQMLPVAYTRHDGSYRFRGVERGSYEMSASAVGCAFQRILEVRVEQEVVRRDIVFATGASIEGRVTDSKGRPLENAEVVAFLTNQLPEDDPELSEFSKRMSLLRGAGEALTRTRADGSYRLEPLSQEAYAVVARREGYEARNISPVRPGDAIPDLALCRFSAVRGTVLDAATGEPVTAFSVEALERSKLPPVFDRLKSRRFIPFFSTVSRNDLLEFYRYRVASEGELFFQHPSGRFLFDGLRPGAYMLLVRAPGYGYAFEEVTLTGGQEAPLEVGLERGGCVEGVVLDAETGARIPGAEVRCRPRERELQATPYAGRNHSNEDGVFSVCGLSISLLSGSMSGTYSIRVSHPRYLPERTRSVKVTPGDEPVWVEVSLAPAGRLEGRIRGMPTASEKRDRMWYEVILEKTDAGRDPRRIRSASSSSLHMRSGRYYADSLEPGTYRLELKRQECEPGEVQHVGPLGFSRPIRDLGPEEIFVLGEVEIQARKTTHFDFVMP